MYRHPTLPRRVAAASLLALLLFVWTLSAGCSGRSAESSDRSADDRPTLILISLDGFRWDYLDRYDAPTLERLASSGARAEKLIPAFPSKTFPSHYTAVTGLYPGRHGIVSNNFYDPELDAHFSLSDRSDISDPRWWGGEPIWVSAEKQGKTAATYFWPGSEAPIQDVQPTYWLPFDGSVPGSERVDQVLDWLDLSGEERPHFIALYFGEVDRAGHRHGPIASEVAQAVERVDGFLRRLVDGLEERNVLEEVNLIIISDHGMAETSPDRVIFVDDYFDPEEARIIELSPVLMMYPPEGFGAEIFDALSADPHLQVYWRENLPERFHLNHPRVPPLLALAEPGWVLKRRASDERDTGRAIGGTHGYDNRAPSMAGIFIAHGPSFRKGATVEPFEIVHLYELMCELLGLDPAPNDGDPDLLRSMILNETYQRLLRSQVDQP